jgi:hypothetical protein
MPDISTDVVILPKTGSFVKHRDSLLECAEGCL